MPERLIVVVPAQFIAVNAASDEEAVDARARCSRDVMFERVANGEQAARRQAETLQAGAIDSGLRLAMVMHRAAHALIGQCDRPRRFEQAPPRMDAVAVRIAADHRQTAR